MPYTFEQKVNANPDPDFYAEENEEDIDDTEEMVDDEVKIGFVEAIFGRCSFLEIDQAAQWAL